MSHQPPIDSSLASAPTQLGSAATLRAWPTVTPLLCFALSAALLALRQSGTEPLSPIWDDTLFFRRVSHNILAHSVAGWNVSEGPVFINTSQLHQGVSTLLLRWFPATHNGALFFWSALCLALAAGASTVTQARTSVGALLSAVAFSAPPVLLTTVTGMETASVLLVVSLVASALLGPWGWARTPGVLALLQLLTYLAHPDAILLSFAAATGVLWARGQVRDWLKLGLYTAGLLAVVSGYFQVRYGTVFPLSTFLKISPISVYDSKYIHLGDANKWMNLRLLGFTAAPLLTFSFLRRDRINAVLVVAALLFVGFHAVTTNEIMGYHARFYAPCFPLLIAAALRGVAQPPPRRELVAALGALLVVAGTCTLATERGWIESAASGGLETVPAGHYAAYFGGFVAVIAALCLPPSRAALASALAALALLPLWITKLNLTQPLIRLDAEGDLGLVRASSALVGAERIKHCFEEPLTFTHSELGAMGVYFLESRVIDYTGLANRDVVAGTFDFDRMCTHDRPDFIYRPHWTHERLNQLIDQSGCLKSDYVLVEPNSSAALYARADLAQRYRECTF
jgi:hypothetical protein